MRAIRTVTGRALSWYEWRVPYFPGKWRTVRWADRLCGGSFMSGCYLVQRRGLKWELDLQCCVQRSLYYLNINAEEVNETDYVERLIKPGWYVVDVGANFGYYTQLAGRLTGPEGRVYAFEPSPSVFHQLHTNVLLNQMDWVQVFPLALGHKNMMAFIPITSRAEQGRQGVHWSQDPDAVQIQVTTLDEFVTKSALHRVDFIKVDIEGFEIHFLKGAKKVLHHFRPIMMVELNPSALARYGHRAEDLLALLRVNGYDTFVLNGRSIRPLTPLPAPKSFWNLLAIPCDRHSEAT